MKILIEDIDNVGYFVSYLVDEMILSCRYFSDIDHAYDRAIAANNKFGYPILLRMR